MYPLDLPVTNKDTALAGNAAIVLDSELKGLKLKKIIHQITYPSKNKINVIVICQNSNNSKH